MFLSKFSFSVRTEFITTPKFNWIIFVKAPNILNQITGQGMTDSLQEKLSRLEGGPEVKAELSTSKDEPEINPGSAQQNPPSSSRTQPSNTSPLNVAGVRERRPMSFQPANNVSQPQQHPPAFTHHYPTSFRHHATSPYEHYLNHYGIFTCLTPSKWIQCSKPPGLAIPTYKCDSNFPGVPGWRNTTYTPA